MQQPLYVAPGYILIVYIVHKLIISIIGAILLSSYILN